MLKLSPNQVIRISAEARLKKRIYLNLKNIFNDHRQQTVVTIDEKVIKRIVDLKKHIIRRFRINRPFYLMSNNGYYLHPLESIDILRDEEIICLNLKDSVINNPEAIGNGVEENSEKSKKRKAVDDLSEQNTKCIKMITNKLMDKQNEETIESTCKPNSEILRLEGDNNQTDGLCNDEKSSDDRKSSDDNQRLGLDDPRILGLNDVIDFSSVRSRRKCLSEQFENNPNGIETNVQNVNVADSNKKRGKGIIILRNCLISPAKSTKTVAVNDKRRECVDGQFEDAVDDKKNQECLDVNNEEVSNLLDNTSEISKTMFTSWTENDKKNLELSKTKMASWTDTDVTMDLIKNRTDLELSKTMMAHWTDVDETLNKSGEKKRRKRTSYNSHVLSGVGCVLNQLRNEASEPVKDTSEVKKKMEKIKDGKSSKKTSKSKEDVTEDNKEDELKTEVAKSKNKKIESSNNVGELKNVTEALNKNNKTLKSKTKNSESDKTLTESMDLDESLKGISGVKDEDNGNLNNDELSDTFDRPDFVTKRRRRRNRHSKKNDDLNDTTITNTSVEFRPPKTTPKIHKRFTDDETDKIDGSDTSVSMDEKSLNITPDVSNYSQFLHSTPYQVSNKMSVIPEESFVHPLNKFIENSKTFTSKPKINDKILFKKLKLDENYTPIVSDFIYGKILRVSDDGDVQIKILKGQNELRDPEGKFSLQDDTEADSSIFDTKWNLLLDTRLINDKH